MYNFQIQSRFLRNQERTSTEQWQPIAMSASGVPERMVSDPGVAGQPGDVEPAVGDLGPAVPRPAALPQGVDAGAELLQRVRHPDRRHPLWEGRRPSTLTEQDSAAYCIIQGFGSSDRSSPGICLSRINHTKYYLHI